MVDESVKVAVVTSDASACEKRVFTIYDQCV